MLINYNFTDALYIVGTGIAAEEIAEWIRDESNIQATLVSKQEYIKLPAGSNCILGFANMDYRTALINDPGVNSFNWVSFVHPKATVTKTAKLGPGTVIQPLVCIGHNVRVGDFGWIAAMSHVGHGSELGNNNVVGPGTLIAGSTQIGDNVLFGQSCSVRDKIRIGNKIEFTMNSVVTKDIAESGNYYGNKKLNV